MFNTTTRWRDPRVRRWTAHPARPIRYWLPTRSADAFNGWRDGRRGLPEVSGDEGRPPGTQRLAEIHGMTLSGSSAERLTFRARESAIREAREAARSRFEGAAGKLESAWSARQWVQRAPEEADLTSRRIGEPDLSAVEVRRRRRAEYDRRLRRAAEEYLAAQTANDTARHELELLDELLVVHRSIGLIRERRVREHALRRAALYWRHLVRVHPDGAALNGRLNPVGDDLPRWASPHGADDNDEVD
jgi:hypothetical protein